jgi:hypothetical protein
MLPVDFAATLSGVTSPWTRFRITEYALFPVINGLVLATAGAVLAGLGFGSLAAAAGSLSLLFCSTLLWHFQNNQENPLQFLLVLTALLCMMRWTTQHDDRALVVGGLLLALDVLIRLPNTVDVLAVSGFPAVTLWQVDRARVAPYVRAWLRYAAPGVMLGLIADRAYHFARFGTWSGTYMHMSGVVARQVDPGLPASFPFSHPFWHGLLGPFVSLPKSIFLYDPLLVVAIIAVASRWHLVSPQVKTLFFVALGATVATAAGYARFYNWSAQSGWGDRFLTTWVWILCLIAVPLLIERTQTKRKALLGGVLFAMFVCQAASTVIPSWVEELQLTRQRIVVKDHFTVPEVSYRSFILGQRFVNLTAGALGTFDHWGLGNTPNGRIGPHPPILPVAAQFKSMPLVASAIHFMWWCGLAVLAWMVRSMFVLPTETNAENV